MVSTLEAWVQRLVAARSVAPVAPTGDARRETRLVGEPEVVTRLLVVRPDTVAVVVAAGAEPQLRHPGDLLVPPLLAPGAPAVVARAISTAPLDVDVTVTNLVTFDGHPVERAVLRLTLQLDDSDGNTALLELVGTHPDDLEEQVLEAVHREVTAAVRGAVRMNRLADLQRLTLAVVLQDRWLPTRFGSGTLRCQRLRVQRVRWTGEDEATVPLPVPAGAAPLPAPPVPASPPPPTPSSTGSA